MKNVYNNDIFKEIKTGKGIFKNISFKQKIVIICLKYNFWNILYKIIRIKR